MSRISVSGGGGGTGSVKTANLKIGIAPNEAANGSRVLFTVPDAYVSGTLAVYRSGERIHAFTETSPGAGTFTLSVAPGTTEAIKCDYVKA